MQYLPPNAPSILLFTAYFHEGRSRFGAGESDETRRGRIAACRNVMRLARKWMTHPGRIPRSRLEGAFALFEQRAAVLSEGTVKSAYLEMLALLRETVT